MQTVRRYQIIILLAAALTLVLLGNIIREPQRLKAAAEADSRAYIEKGAGLYAQQCVQCHGPKGEGVIGMPLNRGALRVDPATPAGEEMYRFIYDAIWQGRKGVSDHPSWVKMPDGRWLSYTSMAAFGYPSGGALNEDQARALTLFIINPDGSQWSLPGSPEVAPFEFPTYPTDATGQVKLPDPPGLDPATLEEAKAVLRDRTRSQCLNCHTIGQAGARVGPDLSDFGRWGMDREALREWLEYANNPMHSEDTRSPVPQDKRMPVYWSENRAVYGPEPNLANPVISEGPYYMLRFAHRLTAPEIDALTDYLMALRLR